MRLISAGLLTAAAVLVSFLLAAPPFSSGVAVATPPAIDLVAVDMLTSGNSATALGPVDDCIQVNRNISHQIDIVVDAIPPNPPADGGGISGFQFFLHFDPQIVQITNVDNNFLLTSAGGGVPVDFTDPLSTQGDGVLSIAAADFGSHLDSGPGVLSRITVKGIADGRSELSLTGVILADAMVQQYPTITTISEGHLPVGRTCTSVCPEPDTDGDTVGDACDNCPATPNEDQRNVRHPTTQEGDACEDPDGDGVFDSDDNCPDAYDPGQENTDGDPFGDACDPCPTIATTWNWYVPDDTDCDGFSDEREAAIGTDPAVGCMEGPGLDDPSPTWPPDMNSTGNIDILDVLALKKAFGATPIPPRYDLLPDGAINILDALQFKPFFSGFCTQ